MAKLEPHTALKVEQRETATGLEKTRSKLKTDPTAENSDKRKQRKGTKVKREARGKSQGETPYSAQYTAGSGPNPDVPASWRAWYAAMPHLDVKQAHKQHAHDEERKVKLRKVEESKRNDHNKDLLDMDLEALNLQLEEAQKDCAKQVTICTEFKKEISKAEELDKMEEEQAQIVNRRLLKACYRHGVVEGKIRSSETYFAFIYDDTTSSTTDKINALTRTSNLMSGEIAALKMEVRDLLKQARDDKDKLAVEKKGT